MENIEFELELGCTEGPDGYPLVKIGTRSFDPFQENVYWQGNIVDTGTVKFSADIDDGEFELFVDFQGNPTDKLIVDKNTGLPTNAGVLSIKKISVDDIALEHIFYTNSIFNVDESEIYVEDKVQKECIDFGNKGVWLLPLNSPVYIWLLENL